MLPRYLLSTFAVLSFSALASAINPSDLKPGLIARFAETEAGKGTTIHRLEPTVALALNPGETQHPRLAKGQSTVWTGYINVIRPGKYTFSAALQGGKLTVVVGGKNVFTASADKDAALKLGDEVALEGGVQPFSASFVRAGDTARVELFWQGPGFVKEPLPHQFLGHLPKDQPEALARDVELELGRFKFEELSCIRCHKPDAGDAMARGLAERAGPNLSDIGKRAYAGWIDAWLADPAKLRPQTTMPAMFGNDDQGRAERFAVTKFLLSLAGGATIVPPKPAIIASNEIRASAEKGRVLYHVTGCAACHQEARPRPKNDEDDREPLKPEDYFASLGTSGPTSKYILGALGGKTRPEALANYLLNPHKTNPGGRMPHMNLKTEEATDIARYLCRTTEERFTPEMPAAPRLKPLELARKVYGKSDVLKEMDDLAGLEKLTAEKQWVEIGRKLVVVKGCVDCHAIEQGGKPLASSEPFPKLAKIQASQTKGCLGEKPNPAKVPVYQLDGKDAAAIAAFLKTGLTGAGSPAPAYSARAALRRFNCLNCHSRDGEGGIPAELADQMRLLEKAENADDVRPPLLTGIGHKSRTSWLKSVLAASGRARPWMQLRMPQYGETNVAFLPAALAALEGAVPDDSIFQPPLNGPKIQLGRQIIGKSGLGCISCHDIGGVPNTGTRGPDLATINQRVRYEWYERWMHQPLRMAPGTRMPQAFIDGKSTLSSVLGGDPKAQAEAMWSYLSLGPGLPLPEGLEPPKGLVIFARERPEVLRTFMPDAGSKGIAVGYPGGLNLAFSADQCRLAYAWAGNFLDAAPVWADRGGRPAKLLGPKFWTAPPGHPWGLTIGSSPPDFLGRANNPAFGLPVPLEPARIYDGPNLVHFDGYSLDKDDRPTFRYTLRENDKDGILKVAETMIPLKASVAMGFSRQFQVELPAGYRAWLLAGQSTREPRGATTAGLPLSTLDLKAAEPLLDAAGARIVLPQEGDKAIVLEAAGVPPGTAWRLAAKSGGGWLAMLRFPALKENWKGTIEIVVWAIPKDDDQLLKDLGTKP